MTSRLVFGDCADLRQEKIDPKNCPESKYIGLEHIAQESLVLLGYGKGGDVDSQKQKFYRGDILFGKLRPYFRKVIIAPFDGICSTDIWVVQPKANIDRDFLFYWMASKEFVDSASVASEGTRMPRAKWDWVSQFEVPLKNNKEQVAAAKILSLIDKRIAQNAAISEILESIAQSIFKSWFIDFDPVHAKSRGEKPFGMDDETAALFPDSFEESELGMIPKGWEFENIANFAQIRFGAPFSSALFNTAGEGNPLIRIRDLKNQATNISTTEAHSKGFLAKPGDLLVGMDGEFTPVVWFGDPSLVNQRICMFEPINQVHNFYLYFNLIPVMKQIENGAAGTTVIHLSKGELDSISLLQPGSELLEHFKSIVSPICLQMASVMNQNRRLSRLRDLLLPKLISGELQIPEELLVS